MNFINLRVYRRERRKFRREAKEIDEIYGKVTNFINFQQKTAQNNFRNTEFPENSVLKDRKNEHLKFGARSDLKISATSSIVPRYLSQINACAFKKTWADPKAQSIFSNFCSEFLDFSVKKL